MVHAKKMATAIYHEVNVPSNCIDYNRKAVEHEKELIGTQKEQIELLDQMKTMSEEKLRQAEIIQKQVKSIMGSVAEVTAGNEDNANKIEEINTKVSDILNIAEQLNVSVDDMEEN